MESKTDAIRPTKKQRELLTFIGAFIAEHGYSPSYREIMAGMEYTSVATVALHVNSLIKRGHLRKRDFSARSLELVRPDEQKSVTTNLVLPGEEKWLVNKTEHAFKQAEQMSVASAIPVLDDLYILVEALRVLGLDAAAQSFRPRLVTLRAQVETAAEH